MPFHFWLPNDLPSPSLSEPASPFIRMHAATKAGNLGVGLIMAAVAVKFADLGIAVRAFADIAFLIITAPVAAHLIGRAADRQRVPLWRETAIDEWRGHPQAQARTPALGDGR